MDNLKDMLIPNPLTTQDEIKSYDKIILEYISGVCTVMSTCGL